MKNTIFLLSYIALSQFDMSNADNVNIAYTNYTYSDPNKCTLVQADPDKVKK